MPILRSLVASRPLSFAVSPPGILPRLATCLLLTAFNAAVAMVFGRLLYEASAGQPLKIIGVTVLFAAMFASLVRVWITGLRGH